MRIRTKLAVGALGLAIVLAIGGHAGRSDEGSPASTSATTPTTTATTPEAIERPAVRDARVALKIVTGELRLEGQAVDGDEHPIAGATITLNGTRTTVTELDGSFAFDGLGAADYALTGEKQTDYGEDTISLDASSDPLILKMQSGPTVVIHVIDDALAPIANVAVETTGHAATTDRAGIVRLRGVDTDDIAVEFKAPGFASLRARLTTGDDPAATIEHTIALHPGAPAGGVVVDQDGKPVPDAFVWFQSASTWRESVNTDATGHWQVDSLGAGKHVVAATSPVHVATADQVFELDGHHAKNDLVVRVALGGRISGTVTDRAGKPVADASVSAGGTETTDAAGHYEAKGIGEGTVDVSATTKTQGSAIQHITLARGGHAEVNLVLVDASIAGIVKDSHGEPIDEATVYARGKGEVVNASSFERTDEHGRFDLGGMAPGEYELVVERKEEQSRSHPANAIVRTGNRSVTVVLPELVGISGRVMLDGKPVDYYGVLIDTPDSLQFGHPITVRAADGRFEQHDLRPGTWGVAIVGPGFVRKELKSVTVVDDKITDLGDIVVEHGRSVSGRTIDDRGVPIADATVTISTHRRMYDDTTLGAALHDARAARTDGEGR